MKAASNLEKVLSAGHFAVTGELGPPRGADAAVVRKKAAHLKGIVDSVNITDNQTAVVRMSSVASCKLLLDEGLEPNPPDGLPRPQPYRPAERFVGGRRPWALKTCFAFPATTSVSGIIPRVKTSLTWIPCSFWPPSRSCATRRCF